MDIGYGMVEWVKSEEHELHHKQGGLENRI